jgi:hypothetical protein
MRTGKITGDLVVLTPGQEGVAVLANGKNYGETSDRGLLTLSLAPQAYTVVVEKSGFQRPMPQKTTVRRGSRVQLTFELVPEKSMLQITDGTPGATIFIDGVDQGTTISSDGRASIPVAPGSHEVGMSRQGYRPSPRIRLTFEGGKPLALGGPQVTLVPEPPPPPDPNQVRAQEWAGIQNSRDLRVLDAFRRKYPNTQEAEQATRRMAQAAWDNLDKTDANAIRVYTQQYPNSPNLADAQRALATLEQAKRAADDKAKREADDQQAKRVADEQQAKQRLDEQAKAEQAKADQAAKRAADIQAVSRMLVAYKAAFERRDINALLAVWPTMSKETLETQRNFLQREATELHVNLQQVKEPEISADGKTASVLVDRQLSGKGQQGRALPMSTTHYRFVLTRTSTGFTIQSAEALK